MDKKCFKCHKIKPINKFYKHKQMADGHLNKCIECTKKDVRRRFYDPEARPKIKEYERKRFQTPHRKAKAIEYQRRRRQKNPGKEQARRSVRNALKTGLLTRLPCETCGDTKSEAHHKSYRELYNVVWLCFKHHREVHGQLMA